MVVVLKTCQERESVAGGASICPPSAKTDLELHGKQFKSDFPDSYLNFCLSQVITPNPDLEKT